MGRDRRLPNKGNLEPGRCGPRQQRLATQSDPRFAERFFTLIELADYLDLPGEDLLELIQEEDPGIWKGEEWLVPLDDVAAWLLRLMK